MIKLIASDLDGTLLNSNHEIDKESIEAIKKAESSGIIFAISTGREYESVRGLLEENNLKVQCILSNGAEYRDEEGNILEVVNINKDTVREIIRVLDENKLSARIFTSDGIYTTSSKDEALEEAICRTMALNPSLTREEAHMETEKLGFFRNLKYIDNIDEFLNSDIEFRKFVAFHHDIERIDNTKSILGKIDNLAVSSSFRDNIEITDINAQKGIILEKVSTKMNLKNEEVMILGDSFNDYSMFEVFTETVAMKNAIEEVKDIAKYITDTNDNLGVAKAINYVLNNEMDKMLK